MSDITTDAPLPPLNPTDPTASNPDGDTSDTTGTTSNSGTITDNTTGDSGNSSPLIDPNVADAGAQGGTNQGTVVATSALPPQPVASQPLLQPHVSPLALGSSQQSASNPDSTASASNTDNASVALGSRSNGRTKAIIIASSLSGAVALVLAMVVIFLVYRRSAKRRRPAASEEARRGSDATWIGPPIPALNNKKLDAPILASFDDDKLETGSRNSDATVVSEAYTACTLVSPPAGSPAQSAPFHTPSSSIDTIVSPSSGTAPADTKPTSTSDKPGSQLEKGVLPPGATQRRRKSCAPSIRINSNSTFNSTVEIEGGETVGPQSPASPAIPLVTPIEPPQGWRQVEYLPTPTRHNSGVPLSRQSSKASSRHSPIVEQSYAGQGAKTGTVATWAKKRRSRADSIDPFRKSSATVKTSRRKSRAESVTSMRVTKRKLRADSIAPSVASHRRSRSAGSIASAKSAVFSAPLDFMPGATVGLPATPRSSAAPRRPRVSIPIPDPREPLSPRTPTAHTPQTAGGRAPASRPPRTPMTAPAFRTSPTAPPLRTPVSARAPGGHPRLPSVRVPRTPTSVDDAVHWRAAPLPPLPATATATMHAPRPLPSVPGKGSGQGLGPAELNLAQLSRALAEVSS
ncbi:hypothetical protein BD413DRAFT_474123 [Trametes elegans]|nr:hypothetical protein BD413DRAFT_474123 [Trametes elegans]